MAMALPVVRARLTVVRERPLEPFLERRSRPPAEGPRDLADVRVEVARLLRLSLGGEGRELPARAREGRERLGDLAERRRLATAHVQDLAEYRVRVRREEDGLDAVVDVEEIAQDRPVAEDGDRGPVEREAHEPVHDAVARVAHLGPRAVDVREAQYRPLDPVDVPVPLDDLGRGEVRDLVEAARVRGRILGHGQRVRAAVLAARPRVDDARGRVVPLEGFHEDGRAPDVDVDVRERVREGEDVVHLPREVEDDVLAAHGLAHRLRIADVRHVDGDAALHGLEVEKVAAVARDHRVHDADRRARRTRRDREVAPDEPGAARHEGADAREGRDRGAHGAVSIASEKPAPLSGRARCLLAEPRFLARLLPGAGRMSARGLYAPPDLGNSSTSRYRNDAGSNLSTTSPCQGYRPEPG